MPPKILKETRVPAVGQPIFQEKGSFVVIDRIDKMWVCVQILEASKRKPTRVRFFPSRDCEILCIPLADLLKALDIVR